MSTPSRPVVLLAEDDESIANAWMEAIRMHGYAVVWAPTGKAALSLAETVCPDLLVTDWLLPGIDGMGLYRLFREDPQLAHVPVIVVLASSLWLPVEPAAELHILYLRKPVEVAALCAAISASLAHLGRPDNSSWDGASDGTGA